MSFKVMGVTAGRKDSNSEILLKEALLACKNQGAEAMMINLRDYNILECTGCTACTHAMTKGKYVGCSLDGRDDKKTIMDIMLNQDAVIFSAPTYDLMPTATFLKFMHRNLSYESSFLEEIGEVEHRDRIGALIAVGGSTRSWQSMALEAMQATCFTNDFKIVDMLLATRVPAPKQCLLNNNLIKRAHQVGENIMKSLNTKVEDRKWLGDEKMGWCPNCHSNALILGEPQWDGLYFPIECQVCGAGGDLQKTEDGKWKFVIAENGLCRDRTDINGRACHGKEIAHTQGGFYTEENLSIVKEKFAKYKDLEFPSIKIEK
ncbi:multimeric flavodoxin WrbA [Clostridium acetobutylicum]|uniref:Multimeric flavodoxin WrbA fused to cytochrome c-like domain n=1 Tax=Clostridium acetobutylicum (strain ATCC 824 / DSM 792 / JCM 1419 / IAM 19013 / LMG 5710 / NBRC 13948 / NRRL B-527 / VKM B-1787 / 2291 / W) TaxID=272562 RepID=Q97G43_CLOAB|nr:MULTISPECIES: flavodoxin family protein [Clostridium]AAK80480.1 Multimeric flavodoxin WrbA fused to cytochrome c-like domain [Clostridium acetobutylicum ATCC 824]ADZ21578.1 Multimeric flavodoxin WrbA fused to cytochrome c-like domain [Clostridium acetobutylicum EA 2018]AEI32412.1 multimeric flavodoxin WrbA/cytochrome c-like domain-containing protein [Clostridium acetobutylicum DSM 1731]AWV79103.1 flavodoxin family protein [Clostridium acetobutylicum]MBC2394936.1 flavodoxin family protein [C